MSNKRPFKVGDIARTKPEFVHHNRLYVVRELLGSNCIEVSLIGNLTNLRFPPENEEHFELAPLGRQHATSVSIDE